MIVVLENLSRQLRQKTEQTKAINNGPQTDGRIKIPGTYRRTPAEVEASLLAIMTPEELARMGRTNFDSYPITPKPISEMINEDRPSIPG